MEKTEFAGIRKRLGKTQKQMAQLLGTSLKAVQSFEQGWRNIPMHVERQAFFLLIRQQFPGNTCQTCWEVEDCTPEMRRHCPAWQLNTGNLCWFVNGSICQGEPQKNWHEKMKTCRRCKVFKAMLPTI